MLFVQTVADLANRPQNIEILQNAGKKDSISVSILLIKFQHFPHVSCASFPQV